MKTVAKILLLPIAAFVLAPMPLMAKTPASNTMPLSDVGSAVEIPNSVQDVVDKLNGASDDVSLEDLNAAREAVAKLDVLLDIEKKLKDLAKVRQDREAIQGGGSSSSSSSSVVNMLPPTAFPPTDFAAPPSPVPSYTPPKSTSGPKKVDILRISGSSGKYAAIYESNGTEKTVRVGDKMSDGSRVISISQRGVVLLKNKKRVVAPVKGIGHVFGARR